MPIPEAERAAWLQRLADAPDETVVTVAALVERDLQEIGTDQVLRVGNKVLNGQPGKTLILTLLTTSDVVPKIDLAKQYIESARIDDARPGERSDDLP